LNKAAHTNIEMIIKPINANTLLAEVSNIEPIPNTAKSAAGKIKAALKPVALEDFDVLKLKNIIATTAIRIIKSI